jgi:hypothetical protein
MELVPGDGQTRYTQLTFRVRAVPQPPRIMSERILVEPESLGSTSLAI